MQTSYTHSTQKMVKLAIMSAIIVVLQLLSYTVKIGQFSLSLVLIPIVLGGALFGMREGAFLGFVFGFVTLLACIFGMDVGGQILWNAQPFWCALLCLLKGTCAGLMSAAVFSLLHSLFSFRNGDLVSVLISAAVAPVVNTGIFLLGMRLFFYETLQAWAGGASTLTYLFLGLAGLNFIIELVVNLVFSPAMLHLYHIFQKQSHR